MSTTAEANISRKACPSPPTAGVGPAEQDTAIITANGPISGAGGKVRLYGSAGTHALAPPNPNSVWLLITDMVGAAHVITGNFNGQNSTTLTFNGTAGSRVDLTASDDGSWNAYGQNGITFG